MPIAAQVATLVIEQGASFTKRYTWKAGSPAAPVDISNYVARMQIKDKKGGTEILLLTEANGRLINGGAAGTIDLALDEAATLSLTFKGEAFFDLELEEQSTNFVRRLVEGRAVLSLEVTTV
jgi:hypothetical protein